MMLHNKIKMLKYTLIHTNNKTFSFKPAFIPTIPMMTLDLPYVANVTFIKLLFISEMHHIPHELYMLHVARLINVSQ